MPKVPIENFPSESKFCLFDNLSSAASDLAEASVAAATRRAYWNAIVKLRKWLDGQPLSDCALAEYLTELHAAGHSPATASQIVAAVRFMAKASNRKDLVGPVTRRILAGIRRAGRDRGRGQARGISWQEAERISEIAANGVRGIAGVRDAAIVATASDALLRVGELSALAAEDVELWNDGTGRLTIRHSKTDQEGKGAVLFLGPPTVRRLAEWIDRADIADGPLFRQVREGGRVVTEGLSAHSMRKIIKRCADDAGIGGAVRGHSLRVGSAQSLASAGAGLVELQMVGRWKSPMMSARYARAEIAARAAVARYRYGSLPDSIHK